MPRVQTFLSNDVIEEVNSIVESRRAEGASTQDASFSNTVSMLVELGLRVYRLQRENNTDAFNQTEFNKLLLDNAVRARITTQKILGILTYLPDIANVENFSLQRLVDKINSETDDVNARIFPPLEEGDLDGN
ncbi:conjugal transfer relaxosome DNA-binding protein TraM [Chimaeribacter arupi]|uniref:conjugal transfer relaxosome DNA-binding protein TraM n=1 Tax=Chimaeribacter arupi TaxID=2060066 RepID=UPI000C7B6A3D|nr:conjugal transfer relaxosome DNA-binding protein TraM [Chimaeribacter arupi]PLR29190.1 conjugal transfer protein TraM [Chimaeribacter arupi]